MVRHRITLASGLRLSVSDLGSGIPVLLVHAWGETHRTFDRLVPLLAPHVRLLVPDQRGVGHSDKPINGYALGQAAADLVELMDALALPSAFVVGTSSGGYVAQQIGVDHAGRVDGLVLVGSPRSLADGRDPFGGLLAELHDPVTPAEVQLINGAIALCHPVSADFLADQNRSSLSIPRHVWQAAYVELLAATPPLDVGAISVPTLLLWGEADDVLPRSQMDALVGAVPGAHLVVYPNTGHLVLWERPDLVAADVLHFVKHHRPLVRGTEARP